MLIPRSCWNGEDVRERLQPVGSFSFPIKSSTDSLNLWVKSLKYEAGRTRPAAESRTGTSQRANTNFQRATAVSCSLSFTLLHSTVSKKPRRRELRGKLRTLIQTQRQPHRSVVLAANHAHPQRANVKDSFKPSAERENISRASAPHQAHGESGAE